MITIEDFKEIYETFDKTRNMIMRLNGELGYGIFTNPSPLEIKMTKSLETLCKYAPDEVFFDIVMEELEDSGSEFRARKSIERKFGIDEERSKKIIQKVCKLLN